MIRHRWRRFRARQKFQKVAQGNFAQTARSRLERLLREVYGGRSQRVDVRRLDAVLKEQAERAAMSDDPVDWFVLLVLRSPAATRAQQAMDRQKVGQLDKQARLYELIDFNDAFVSTVLSMSAAEREGFVDMARHEIARFCMQMGARMFSDEQFEAIVKGLVREIAIYLGARREGFQADMTQRSQDALGVDIIITEPVSGRRLNVDVKTASSFHYRLKDLVREGRVSQEEATQAEYDGYLQEVNGHGEEAVLVTLLRADPNEMGDIDGFEFRDPGLLGDRLRKLFAQNDVQ